MDILCKSFFFSVFCRKIALKSMHWFLAFCGKRLVNVNVLYCLVIGILIMIFLHSWSAEAANRMLMRVLMQVHVQSDPAGRLIVTGEPEQLDNPWGVTPFKKVCELFELSTGGCFLF